MTILKIWMIKIKKGKAYFTICLTFEQHKGDLGLKQNSYVL